MPDNRRPSASAGRKSKTSPVAIDALRARLNLPTTASNQDVINAAAAALQDGTLKGVEALRSRVGLGANASPQEVVDAAARRLAAVSAASPPPARGTTPSDVLNWATRTGRIAASSRATWERNWMHDPVRTDATLRILAPLPSAVAPVVVAAASNLSERPVAHMRPEVSALPARIQRAAARQSNPAMLARWQQQYAGVPDAEVSPDFLMMDGEEWLAKEVRRDEDHAHGLAKQASLEKFEANVAAHNRQTAADADYLRENSGRAWGVSASEVLARRQPQPPA